ncbi:GGDEF domain-containing protein [uncultured Alteromonas sp.]|jgi:diguanylate cyclase (GGDEF)-like protein|uniref:GGDEF domain-containing protein n=1 Tax=uncultured Alteromonas sp. TaxID=179113 RepID=UPI0025F8A549|nr:GGDEF domain-containing protein [uncultured Alteromonas sp.]
MSAEASVLIDQHISTSSILSGIKNPALVMSLSGKVARINHRCRQFLPNIQEGELLGDFCEESGVFGSLRQMIHHARSVSGLHPCRLQAKGLRGEGSWLGFFSVLSSKLTHKPVAVLLEVDDHKVERENRLLALDQDVDKQLSALRHYHRDGIHDPLTGLKNRRYMDSFLKMECDLIKRQSTGGTLVVVDIDHFKRINDIFGHNAGDEVIKVVASRLQNRLRDSDVACRWGGEEFVIFLHNTCGHRAFSTCEELRTLIQQHAVAYQSHKMDVTASFGITSLLTNDSPDSVFARADKALYQAKSMGRNQVQVDT